MPPVAWTVWVRDLSRTCKCVKALLVRSATLSRNSLCWLLTRTLFFFIPWCGRFRTTPHTHCNGGGCLGNQFRSRGRGNSSTSENPFPYHSPWKVGQRDRPLFSFLGASRYCLRTGEITTHLQLPVPHLGSSYAISFPIPLSVSWCGCRYGTQSGPRNQQPGGLWQHRRP